MKPLRPKDLEVHVVDVLAKEENVDVVPEVQAGRLALDQVGHLDLVDLAVQVVAAKVENVE